MTITIIHKMQKSTTPFCDANLHKQRKILLFPQTSLVMLGFLCDKLAVNSVINNYMEIHIFY